MTGLEEQINKLSVANARNSFSKDSAALELQRIRESGQPSESIIERLVKAIHRRFDAQVTKADFRKGVSTDSRLAVDPEIESCEVKTKIEQWIDPQLIDCQCAAKPSPTVVEFEQTGRKFFVLAVPLYSADLENVDGALATLVESTENPETLLAELETLSLGVATGLNATTQAEDQGGLEVLRKTGGIGSVQELGYLLSNQLAAKYGCEQVAFGRAQKNCIQVVAVSGVTQFKSNSPGIISIQQSMEECLDNAKPIAVQTRGELELEQGYRIHQQWSKDCGDASVCSIPLLDGDQVVAVASFQRGSHQPFSQAEIAEIRDKIEGFGPVVQLLTKASRTHAEWFRASLKESLQKVCTPGSWAGKIFLATMLLLTVYLVFGQATYRPRCVAQLAPSETTYFSAPFDTLLKSVHVKAGDEVEKGQLLFVMDTRELQAQLNEVSSQLAANTVELNEAIASGQISVAAQHRKLGTALKARENSLKNKIGRAEVRAPAAGLITQCDLDKKVGQAFRIGDEMLVFAQLNHWQVEVDVPDYVASYVCPEQKVTFASTTRPGETFEFEINQLERDAQVKDGRNVFVAKGRLDKSRPWMKSGMAGFARIETVKQPVWWVTFHRVIDLARIQFWF